MDYNNPAAFFEALSASSNLPVPEVRSAASVDEEATARSGKIFTLLKILLNAWPEMAPVHRPDFHTFWKESEANYSTEVGHYEYFLWPYVNQEDLSDTRTLLLFLNSRGRYPPSYFAASDNDAIHLGVVTKAIVPCFLNEHVLMLNGFTENSRDYEYFSELSRQASNLAILQNRYADVISPANDLPKDYHDALLLFQHSLYIAAKGPLGQLKTALFLATLPLVMDELAQFIEANREALQLLSPHIMDVISDLSIIAQCIRQTSLYKPWAQTFETDLAEREDEFNSEYAHRTQAWGRMLNAMQDRNLTRAARLAEPSGSKFAYPIGRRRNQQNTEALRAAESHLDAFWAEIDPVGNLLTQQRILQRTPEWVPVPSGKGPAQEKKTAEHLYELYQPLSRIYSGLPGRSLDVARPKTKTKTRGTPQAPTPTTAELPPTAGADHQPIFAVKKRALEVFRTLFFDRSATSTPGEDSWTDFVYAMTAVGFEVMKLYGSAWQFKPTRLDVERSIQFHEPHPEPKMAYTVARRFGRRLNRAYGWVGGMFREEDE
ncbi:hypothetical protein BJX76DRAFT_363528 [Aspergillus varians]